jgi:endogenous inhibitor of DNA gyrase (YacG/DUF329 family)
MAKRNAIISAAALEVGCPFCGEPQPSPSDGSHLWYPSQVMENQGARNCVSCDKPFTVHVQNRVSVGEF